MNRNTQAYKEAAAKAIGVTFLQVLLRLERMPEKHLTPEQRRLKRRLKEVRK